MPKALKKPKPLSPEAAYRQLEKYPQWIVKKDRLERDIHLKTFVEALKLVERIGSIAESLGHHPNICIHEYHFVHIETYTHLIGGISQRDIELVLAVEPVIRQITNKD